MNVFKERKPNGYWNKENINEIALNFDSRKAFKDNYNGKCIIF
jgi:hypothetical protein